jgi:hypothetical protein
MMKRLLSYATAIVAALTLGQFAVAQAAAPAAPAPLFAVNNWYFNENVQLNTFKGNGTTLVGLNQNLGFNLTKDVVVDLNVPVYTQDDHTSVSNIDLGGKWGNLFGGKNSVIGDWNIGVGGGIYIPVGTEYFRNANVNPYLNAKFNCDLWVLDFSQSVDYRFVGGGSYITWLGAKTDSDVLTLVTDLSYAWNSWNFGLQFDQLYYVNVDEYQLFLGPVAKWDVASNVNLNAAVLIPVTQQVSTQEADVVVKAGIGIKF